MTDDGKSLTQWHPFHVSHWPKSIIWPEQYDGGDRLSLSWDLGKVTDQEKKQVLKQWCTKLPDMQHVRWLSIWSCATQPLFDAVCKMRHLECLQIKWSNIKKLDAIEQLSHLRYLHIGSSTRIESVQPLVSLSRLRLLELENFKLISDFSPLCSMAGLESLAVTGSMWSRQEVASLEPFAQMTHLESLAIDTSNIESLRPLAALKNLKALGIGGKLPMHEYAWLSAKLSNTGCRWFSPYLELSGTGIGHCKKCGNDAMVMLTGGGTKTLCKLCDKDKVQQHELAFNNAKERVNAE